MKILHTADWHLGQKFMYRDRYEEQREALHWLIETIRDEEIDLLIVSGDVFDTMNPPNNARKLYYDFLVRLRSTSCRHVVIIGGNHDSPTMLNAPKDLLKAFDIHVVGCATDNLADEVIELKSEDGKLEGIVAAVPFLRDQDIRLSVAGESFLEREDRVRKGIYNHYNQVAKLVESYEKRNIPLIATGHLYATGASVADPDKQKNIYVGNIENIDADEFPSVFDYIALGHIHKAQIVGEEYHIRYAGSMIPLSFKEKKDKQSVYTFEFDNRQLQGGVKAIEVPIFRKLETISGTYDEIIKRIDELAVEENNLQTWLKVVVDITETRLTLDEDLRSYCKKLPLEILEVRINATYKPLAQTMNDLNLYSLDNPTDIFKRRFESVELPEEEQKELMDTFLELRNWMNEEAV